MRNRKHAQQQYISALQADNEQLERRNKEHEAKIADLTTQRNILTKENADLRRFATIFKEFHEIVMNCDNAIIAQFINIYRQNHLEK